MNWYFVAMALPLFVLLVLIAERWSIVVAGALLLLVVYAIG